MLGNVSTNGFNQVFQFKKESTAKHRTTGDPSSAEALRLHSQWSELISEGTFAPAYREEKNLIAEEA